MKQKIKKTEWDNIGKSYTEGKTVVEISNIYSVHYSTICGILSKLGIKRRTIKDYPESIKLQGKKQSETKKRLFREGKLKVNGKKDLPEGEIKNLYLEGLSGAQIAEKYKVHSSLIYRRLLKMNLEKRTIADYPEIIKEKVKRGSETRKKSYKEGKFSMARIKLPEQEIISLYLDKKLSTYKIAKIFNCSPPIIRRVLCSNGIERHPNGYFNRRGEYLNINKLDEEKVLDMYSNNRLSAIEISKKLGCSPIPIYRVLKKNNVKRREVGTYHIGKVSPFRKKFNEKEIIDNYLINKKSPYRLAKELNCDPDVIYSIFKRNNVNFRWGSRVLQEKEGDKNPSWRGGIQYEPYDKNFSKEFKESIKIRDGFLCMKCGMREEDSKILFKRGLITHHLNYNKQLTIKENCCALCVRCNCEANGNRTHWTKFFQSLLSERYGYKYDETGNVIIELKENSPL